MNTSTKAIIFNYTKYSDSSVVVKAFTEEFGLETYMLRGIKGKNRSKINYLQSLSLVDISVFRKENKSLQIIQEIGFSHIYRSLPFDLTKTTIAIFLSEVLNKAIQEEEQNKELFQFIETALLLLDNSETIKGFHTHFMVKLTVLLGFSPQLSTEEFSFFNLEEGKFTVSKPITQYYVDNDEAQIFHTLLQQPLGQHAEVYKVLNGKTSFLNTVLLYYSLHVYGFKNIKSHKVLKEVLNN